MIGGQAKRARDANAARYGDEDDYSYQETPYHARRLSLALDLAATAAGRGEVALDIAPGSARTPNLLARHFRQVVAIDIVTRFAVGLADNCQMVMGDLNDPLPIADGAADLVFLGEVVEHLFDPGALLRECRRVLTPGGALVITTPNLAGLQDRITFLFGRSPRHVDPLHEYLHLHIRPFTSGKLKQILAANGFQVEIVRSNHLIFTWGQRRVLNRTMAFFAPRLGGTLIVRAR
jgi:SAM-dependent methyltransferase